MNAMQKDNRRFPLPKLTGLLLLSLIGICGCATSPTDKVAQQTAAARSDVIVLREGDVVKIYFPGSANLDTVQPIRRDGKINLLLIGEVDAAGLTPEELKQKLIKLYASQITSKEITVTVQSSSFPVFVTGSVVHPGKVLTDHPLTALEAVMEAGGVDYNTANLKAVKIIRQENGTTRNYTVNLKAILSGEDNKSFYLKPGDIVYVPERFTLY
jgi:polysaccharide export outer membrane protein